MHEGELQYRVIALLQGRPEIPAEARQSLMDTVRAGEPEIAVDAIWSWIIELEVRIEPDYFAELGLVANEISFPEDDFDRLRANINPGSSPTTPSL